MNKMSQTITVVIAILAGVLWAGGVLATDAIMQRVSTDPYFTVSKSVPTYLTYRTSMTKMDRVVKEVAGRKKLAGSLEEGYIEYQCWVLGRNCTLLFTYSDRTLFISIRSRYAFSKVEAEKIIDSILSRM